MIHLIGPGGLSTACVPTELKNASFCTSSEAGRSTDFSRCVIKYYLLSHQWCITQSLDRVVPAKAGTTTG